jgi:hypothetical protein
MQLEIVYFFSSREDESQEVVFTIPAFNNPIVNGMGGFRVEVLDSEEYAIAATLTDATIDGVTQHATFDSYEFDFIDIPNSG